MEELTKTENLCIIDRESISAGDLIRMKKEKWPDFKNGIVTNVAESQITILFYLQTGYAVNYLNIEAKEIDEGMWQIYWTSDLNEVHSKGVIPS